MDASGNEEQPTMDPSENEEQPSSGFEDVKVHVPRHGSFSVSDIEAMTFNTVDEAESFYAAYSVAVGFGIRKSDKGESNGLIRRREWVCNKEGTRKATKSLEQGESSHYARRETRTLCGAKLRIGYSEATKVYVVKAFIPQHNHMLATSNQIPFIRTNRHVGEESLALTNTMTRVSIRPCHAYEYMVEQSGGYRRVGFTVKDLYNKIDQQRRTAPFESDSEGVLSYMNALAAKDPHFFCQFTADSEDRMVDMFWRDGHSFVDYQCYGDVLIFDNTYKTNVYNRPFVLFVGTNNHRGSIVFGAALLSDETVETYTWLLRKFLNLMNEKMPKAVITDGDEAMRTAIRTVMPEARHRLCIWHIGQNANGHLKSAEKLKAFNRCIRKYQTVEQFDRLWQDMLDEFDLHDNDWINSMYEKRDKFCQAFFRDIFMAGMRSTQRCEGMNKDFKLVLSKSKTLVQVVSLVDRTLMRIRNNQERDDFNTMNSFHSAKNHLEDLEKQASSVFTHDVFKWIFREIMKEAHITLKQGTECHEDGSRVYKVSVYKRPNFEHTVTYYPRKETESAADPIMVCSCGMFEYRGVPCRHMFSVMKKENIFHLHKSLIVKRWSRDARSVCEIPYLDKEMPQEAEQVSRYGVLTADCNRLCFYASKTQEGYNMLKMEIDRLAAIMEGLASDQKKLQGTATPTKKGSIVRDPVPSKTKGREKSDKKNEPSRWTVTCGYCKGGGHNIQTCPVRKEHEKAEAELGSDDPPSVATPVKRVVHYRNCKQAGHTYVTYKKNNPARSSDSL